MPRSLLPPVRPAGQPQFRRVLLCSLAPAPKSRGDNRGTLSPVWACPLNLVIMSCLALLLIVPGCAKVGEPQPPVLLVPRPASDLSAIQYGDAIVLTVPMPTENTNSSPVTSLRQVEVFRLSSSRGQITSPLPEKEYLEKSERILTVTEDKFSGYLHDKTFVFRDEFPPRERTAIYSRSYDYAVEFFNRKMQTAGLSNQATISPEAIPAAPTGLTAQLTQDFVRLTWNSPAQNMDGSTPPRVAGYNLYRSEDPKKFPPAPLNSAPLPKPVYEDRSFQFDKTYYYAVSIVGSRKDPYAESPASPPVEVVARDTFPPEPPRNFHAVAERNMVILLWVAPPDRDVGGYRIYRSEEGSKERQLLQPNLVNILSFRDERVEAGKKYEYFVTAVDTHGNESVAAQTSVEVP